MSLPYSFVAKEKYGSIYSESLESDTHFPLNGHFLGTYQGNLNTTKFNSIKPLSFSCGIKQRRVYKIPRVIFWYPQL